MDGKFCKIVHRKTVTTCTFTSRPSDMKLVGDVVALYKILKKEPGSHKMELGRVTERIANVKFMCTTIYKKSLVFPKNCISFC